MAVLRWFFLGLLAAAVAVALLVQHESNENLRGEIALLRAEQRELAQLETEHERLRAAQISPAELERLRADRVALHRLRAEIDAMRERTKQP